MSIPDHIAALEELAAIDAELKILDDKLGLERAGLDGMKGTLKRLDDKLLADRAQLALLEKTRNEMVGELRTLSGQIDHSRDKMNRARNERETNAAQRELEELRKLVRDREVDANRATADADAVRLQIETSDGEAATVRAELGSTEGSAQARIAEIETGRAEYLAKREATQKKLPPQLLRKYETVRGKKGSAIAQTTDGTCRACHMSLPPQLFHRLRREPLLEQCPSCFRLIYFVAPPTAAGG